jgi:hypothetical protein
VGRQSDTRSFGNTRGSGGGSTGTRGGVSRSGVVGGTSGAMEDTPATISRTSTGGSKATPATQRRTSSGKTVGRTTSTGRKVVSTPPPTSPPKSPARGDTGVSRSGGQRSGGSSSTPPPSSGRSGGGSSGGGSSRGGSSRGGGPR